MNYLEIKEKLEASKFELLKKMENKNLSKEELEILKMSLDNIDYIIELTEMNHFERGSLIQ